MLRKAWINQSRNGTVEQSVGKVSGRGRIRTRDFQIETSPSYPLDRHRARMQTRNGEQLNRSESTDGALQQQFYTNPRWTGYTEANV